MSIYKNQFADVGDRVSLTFPKHSGEIIYGTVVGYGLLDGQVAVLWDSTKEPIDVTARLLKVLP